MCKDVGNQQDQNSGAEQEISRGAFGLFMGFADNKNEMPDILYEEFF